MSARKEENGSVGSEDGTCIEKESEVVALVVSLALLS